MACGLGGVPLQEEPTQTRWTGALADSQAAACAYHPTLPTACAHARLLPWRKMEWWVLEQEGGCLVQPAI